MMRLHRAGVAGLILGGLFAGAAAAEERLVSLLPPVGRPAEAEAIQQAGATSAASALPATFAPAPLAVGPYEAGTGSLKPRGANLPRGAATSVAQPGPAPLGLAPVVAAPEGVPCETPAAAGGPTEVMQFPLPQFHLPDLGGRICDWFCAGPYNPADVDDPTWVRTEALLWWFRSMPTPPLATTSSNPSDLGVLGAPTTQTLFGGDDVHLPMKIGGKMTIGSWLHPSEAFGVEVSYMFLVNHSRWYHGQSDSSWLLARPFFNVLDGRQDSALVANPDIPEFDIFRHPGELIIETPGRLSSFELNGVTNCCRGAYGRIDWIYGFRYLFLGEGININELFQVPDDSPELPGYKYSLNEGFAAKNYVYAPQVGVRTENRWGCLKLNCELKVALGWNHLAAKLESEAWETVNGRTQFLDGGLLVVKSNQGNYNDDTCIVVPEVGVRLAWEIKDHISLTAGYNLLFLSNVWRPGDMIDLRVNPNLIPPIQNPQQPYLPAFEPKQSSFWAQGVTMGIEVRY